MRGPEAPPPRIGKRNQRTRRSGGGQQEGGMGSSSSSMIQTVPISNRLFVHQLWRNGGGGKERGKIKIKTSKGGKEILAWDVANVGPRFPGKFRARKLMARVSETCVGMRASGRAGEWARCGRVFGGESHSRF